jgi:hypothetical protein
MDGAFAEKRAAERAGEDASKVVAVYNAGNAAFCDSVQKSSLEPAQKDNILELLRQEFSPVSKDGHRPMPTTSGEYMSRLGKVFEGRDALQSMEEKAALTKAMSRANEAAMRASRSASPARA